MVPTTPRPTTTIRTSLSLSTDYLSALVPIARACNLLIWQRPSHPCLASTLQPMLSGAFSPKLSDLYTAKEKANHDLGSSGSQRQRCRHCVEEPDYCCQWHIRLWRRVRG